MNMNWTDKIIVLNIFNKTIMKNIWGQQIVMGSRYRLYFNRRYKIGIKLFCYHLFTNTGKT